ncbi:hypothetical protein BGX23_005903 [Mortierella sp. AD031]|nr:hypothetical protein BGX23_005903 [Mortierella sp. AD031]
MIKWVTLTLAKYAPAKAGSFVCRSIVDPEGTASEFLTLQVASEADVRATCRHGGTLPDGKTVRFVPYSSEAQAQQQGRPAMLSLLWGELESVRTGFNPTMSMANATVVSKSAATIRLLQEVNVTKLVD